MTIDEEVMGSISAGLNNMAAAAYGYSKGNGFWEGKDKLGDIPEKLALIHSEVSEALEEMRAPDFTVEHLRVIDHLLVGCKPVGFASELADIIIRVGDLAGGYGINLGEAVKAKMTYNLSRPFKHGKAF